MDKLSVAVGGIAAAAIIIFLAKTAYVFKQRRDFDLGCSQDSQVLEKPYLVVGIPRGKHSCGDVNIDLDPSGIDECENFVQANLEDLHMFSDKQFGCVFCSHVLEHVDDIEKAWQELNRVADVVYTAHPEHGTIDVWTHPGHIWDITTPPGRYMAGTQTLEYARIREHGEW